MKFLNVFLSVLKQFGDFKSRTGKTEYWVFILVSVLISIILGMISPKLSSLYSLIILIPSIAATVRRLHDTGKSGLNFLWALIPILGAIYVIILCIKDSEPNANKWGEVPVDVSM